MSLAMAFEITEDDIEHVLQVNASQVANTDGKTFAQIAADLHNDWAGGELDRISAAALDGGVDMDDQIDAANAEIRTIMVEQGVLKR